MKELLQNRTVQIILAVLLILTIVYFIGRKAGKNSEKESFWNKLFGIEDENPTVDVEDVTVDGHKPSENIENITDAIYQGFNGRIPFVNGNGEKINMAFALFNNLGVPGKASVINDWNDRYAGTDKPYWGTGNYKTIRAEIANVESEGLQLEVAIAYRWMQNNKIN